MTYLADDDPYFTDPHYGTKRRLRDVKDEHTEDDMSVSAEEILASIERGEDHELLKLVDKRAEENGTSRLEALRTLLREVG